jgi:hypothetical protein
VSENYQGPQVLSEAQNRRQKVRISTNISPIQIKSG